MFRALPVIYIYYHNYMYLERMCLLVKLSPVLLSSKLNISLELTFIMDFILLHYPALK